MTDKKMVPLNPLEDMPELADVDKMLDETEDMILKRHVHTPAVAIAFMNLRYVIAEEEKRVNAPRWDPNFVVFGHGVRTG